MATSKERVVKLKVCLIGEPAAGKSSLIHRFAHDEFEDRYTATLGTRVTKSDLVLAGSDGAEAVRVTLLIWDIMGQEGVRELLQKTYFHGAHGGLMVCDITRSDTLAALHQWRDAMQNVTGPIPGYLLATKADLKDEAQIQEEDLLGISEKWQCPYLWTSAKTGEGVREAFEGLARLVLDRHRARVKA